MKLINFEIYKKRKRIGILSGELIEKTELREKHILLSNEYNIKPGYVLIADERDKFYIIDVRIHRSYTSTKKLELYYETEFEYNRRSSQFRHDWLIAIFSAITGLIAGAISGILTTLLFNVILKK